MTTPQSYRLARDVFSCLSDNRMVFLDLRSDKYFCLSEGNTTAAHRYIANAGNQSTSATGSFGDHEGGHSVLETLADKGLMIRAETEAAETLPTRDTAVAEATTSKADSIAQTANPGHWLRFARASASASWKLSRYSMRRTVQSIRNRKYRLRGKAKTNSRDLVRMAETYQYLRPFYPREYLCLYDSLALLEYLAYHRFFPQWVFGVCTEPFTAHCWVQHDECVLNDTVEHVRNFTPIMSI